LGLRVEDLGTPPAQKAAKFGVDSDECWELGIRLSKTGADTKSRAAIGFFTIYAPLRACHYLDKGILAAFCTLNLPDNVLDVAEAVAASDLDRFAVPTGGWEG